MIDLKAALARIIQWRGNGAEHSRIAFRQTLQHRFNPRLSDPRRMGQIEWAQCDLGAARRHEVAENLRGDVLIGLRQTCHPRIEMILHDLPRQPETLECFKSENL